MCSLIKQPTHVWAVEYLYKNAIIDTDTTLGSSKSGLSRVARNPPGGGGVWGGSKMEHKALAKSAKILDQGRSPYYPLLL